MKKTLMLAVMVLAISAFSAADVLPVGGGWQIYNWSSPTGGPVEALPQFSLSAAGLTTVRFVDCCQTGDQFHVFVTGDATFDFYTSAPPTSGVQTGCFDGDCAWANADLSHGILYLGAGNYNFDIWTVAFAEGSQGTGSGFIDANAGVPEPTSLVLLGTGLVGIAGRLRKRLQA